MTFEDIMAFHVDNHDVFLEICEHISRLTPFVGAGLSCLENNVYPTWINFLNSINEKIADDNSPYKELINQGLLPEAASYLKAQRGNVNFFLMFQKHSTRIV